MSLGKWVFKSDYYGEEYTAYDEEYICCYLTRDDGVENRVKVYKLPIKIK